MFSRFRTVPVDTAISASFAEPTISPFPHYSAQNVPISNI